jgi:hypothetical protein
MNRAKGLEEGVKILKFFTIFYEILSIFYENFDALVRAFSPVKFFIKCI